MGHHSVPQRYLRNFQAAEKEGFIWQCDRLGDEPRLLPIVKVAQSKDFYDAETERYLAEAVERPANPLIAALLKNQYLHSKDREITACYIATMIMRVSYRRQKCAKIYPQVLDQIVTELRTEVVRQSNLLQCDAQQEERALFKLDSVAQKFAVTQPQNVVNLIRDPRPNQSVLELINLMTWRVLISEGPNFFITTDNPVFFFECLGFADKHAEFCLPLSPTHALHGSWVDAHRAMEFEPVRQEIVKETNRRLLSMADRGSASKLM